MAIIEELTVLVTAQTAGLDRGLTNATKLLRSFATTALSLRGARAGFAALTSQIGKLDRIGDLAATFGESTDTLQRLDFISGQTGTSLEELARGVGRLQIKIGEAISGSKEAAADFKRLGLEASDLAKLPLEQKLGKVADAIKRLPDQTRRAAAAQSLFSKGGQELLRVLDLGSAGLAQLARELDKIGIATKEQVREAQRLDDELNKLSDAISLSAQKLVAELAPGITLIAEKAIEAIQKLQKFGRFLAELTGFAPTGFQKATNDAATSANKFRNELIDLGDEILKARKAAAPLVESLDAVAREREIPIAVEKVRAFRREAEGALDAFVAINRETIVLVDQFEKSEERLNKQNVALEESRKTLNALIKLREKEEARPERGFFVGLILKSHDQDKINQLTTDIEAQTRVVNRQAGAVRELTSERDRLRGSIELSIEQAKIARDQGKAAVEGLERQNELFEEGAKIIERNLTELELYTRGVEEATAALEAGAIAPETYRREIERLQKSLRRLQDQLNPPALLRGSREAFSALATAANRALRGIDRLQRAAPFREPQLPQPPFRQPLPAPPPQIQRDAAALIQKQVAPLTAVEKKLRDINDEHAKMLKQLLDAHEAQKAAAAAAAAEAAKTRESAEAERLRKQIENIEKMRKANDEMEEQIRKRNEATDEFVKKMKLSVPITRELIKLNRLQRLEVERIGIRLGLPIFTKNLLEFRPPSDEALSREFEFRQLRIEHLRNLRDKQRELIDPLIEKTEQETSALDKLLKKMQEITDAVPDAVADPVPDAVLEKTKEQTKSLDELLKKMQEITDAIPEPIPKLQPLEELLPRPLIGPQPGEQRVPARPQLPEQRVPRRPFIEPGPALPLSLQNVPEVREAIVLLEEIVRELRTGNRQEVENQPTPVTFSTLP